jgi:hypothetical protein
MALFLIILLILDFKLFIKTADFFFEEEVKKLSYSIFAKNFMSDSDCSNLREFLYF